MKVLEPDLASAAAFANAAIGKPWREGAMGPDAYDCWGLARACQREVFGRELPIVDYPSTMRALIAMIDGHPENARWEEMVRPSHGDVVKMTHSQRPHHVGTYLAFDGGRVLHATEREGVLCCSVLQVRLEGFRALRFYRFRA